LPESTFRADWIFVGILMLMVIRGGTVVHLFVLIKNFPLFGGKPPWQGGGLDDTFTD
jgi:hypothetical protein